MAEYAILMAAGMGTRLRPYTADTPKPLLKVGELALIETVILALHKRGVKEIYIVTGYLGDRFRGLQEKYEGITLLKNTVFETVNNISSVYVAREVLRKGACFICEADLLVTDEDLLCADLKKACYFGRFEKGFSDDWIFEQDENGIITRVGKNGTDVYNMAGISYWTAEEAKRLADFIEQEYGADGYEDLFWDDVVNMHISEFALTVHPVTREQITEIDTVEEYEAACRAHE
ncbi:MAG: phosphocholine cytidylyltransferase family protein [Lachnospiraceae bacterium]|nr:phosphocholine cytidylyltransferase family protein [Lachnospiraceae bacterium]